MADEEKIDHPGLSMTEEEWNEAYDRLTEKLNLIDEAERRAWDQMKDMGPY